MRIFIDCEFNEFRGELISMALCAEDGREWYKSLGCDNPGKWVAVNVMPIIGIEPISRGTFAMSLEKFLMQYDTVHIVADWPEDIKHFCETLIIGPGMRINTPPLTMEVLRVNGVSKIPHNALEDARGIMAEVLTREVERAQQDPVVGTVLGT